MSHIYRVNILHWIRNGEASYDIAIPAVERFGEAAVNRQTKWIEATIKKRFNGTTNQAKHARVITNVSEGGYITLLKALPSEEAREQCSIPYITCASPLCPSFDQHIEAGSIIVAIEPQNNLAMSYVPFKPRADLTTVVGSPLDGSNNLRGRGEHDVLWFHLTCLEAHSTHHHESLDCGFFETPTLNQPLAAESRFIQVDQRPLIAGTGCIHLDSPSLQAFYKWQAVIQLEKALAFQDGNEGFYINDDMDAAYLVEKHSKLKGTVEGARVEVTGAQARGRPLSVLLRHIDCLKTIALQKKAGPANNSGYVGFAMSVDQRVEEMSEFSGVETDSHAGDQQTDAIYTPPQPATEGWETGRIETVASDERHIEGLEVIPWTMSRPYSSVAAENDNLGDGLIPSYDRSKWGTLSPEDATLIFWNRVP